MRILIAEDDRTSRWMLEALLKKWNFEVIAACDGQEAWQAMQSEDPPSIAILDWMMPGMEGVEFCRKVREDDSLAATYIILLTGRRQNNDVIAGLDAGANDYIRKPFDREELRARLEVGKRMVELQRKMTEKVKECQEALSKMKT